MRERFRGGIRWWTAVVVVGVLSGAASLLFLEGLAAVTSLHASHRELALGLPIVGLAVGVVSHRAGGRVAEGTTAVVERARGGAAPVPSALGPFALVGTWATHLFGGSAGREGTALQMSGAMAERVADRLHLDRGRTTDLLVVGVAAAFGSGFGVPFAGTVFAFEIARRRLRSAVVVGALVAALIGNALVRAAGYEHAAQPQVRLDGPFRSILALVAVGVACGGGGAIFVLSTRLVRRAVTSVVRQPWLRPVVGGVLVTLVVAGVGSEYAGLSLPLADAALAGAEVSAAAWLIKVAVTALTVGSGFPGGEVTPLAVVGATLAATLAPLVSLDPSVAAACGFVATFSGAAGAPVAGAVMAGEVFGLGAVPAAAVVCVVASIVSRRTRLYVAEPLEIKVATSPRREV